MTWKRDEKGEVIVACDMPGCTFTAPGGPTMFEHFSLHAGEVENETGEPEFICKHVCLDCMRKVASLGWAEGQIPDGPFFPDFLCCGHCGEPYTQENKANFRAVFFSGGGVQVLCSHCTNPTFECDECMEICTGPKFEVPKFVATSDTPASKETILVCESCLKKRIGVQ